MLWSSVALAAAPTDEEKAIARTLFEQGRTLMKAGQWSDACPKLAESQRLDPGIGTLYNLADCHEHTGRLAAAWAEFSEVLDLAKHSGQAEREKIAQQRVSALKDRMAKVTFRRKEQLAAGSDVTLDGKSIGSAVVDVPLPIDPGEHKVGVVENGQKAEKSFTVPANAANLDIDLPLRVEAPAPPPPPPPVERTEGTWHRPTAYAMGGIGLAAIGASVAIGFIAKGKWSDVEAQCPANRCNPRGFEGWNDARDTATLGTVVFVSGLVLVAAATTLWLLAPSTARSTSTP